MRFPRRLAAAAVFLAGSQRRLERLAPARFANIGGYLMLLAVVWGLVLVGLWEAAYRATFAWLLNWVVPACVCAGATVLGPYRQACLSLGDTVALRGPRRWHGPVRCVTLLGLTAAFWALGHALGWKEPDWPTQLSPRWAWLWPKAMYRVLLLTPVWGAWSMLVTGNFHRPTDRTDPPTRHFAATTAPVVSALAMLVPLAATFAYLLFLRPALRFVPPAAGLLGALGGGAAVVRLRGGLDRQGLLAINIVTQLAFLTAAVAVM